MFRTAYLAEKFKQKVAKEQNVANLVTLVVSGEIFFITDILGLYYKTFLGTN
jgi:hypothetical protein